MARHAASGASNRNRIVCTAGMVQRLSRSMTDGAFSPDGDDVLFTRGEKETRLMIVSVKTGELRAFLRDAPG